MPRIIFWFVTWIYQFFIIFILFCCFKLHGAKPLGIATIAITYVVLFKAFTCTIVPQALLKCCLSNNLEG